MTGPEYHWQSPDHQATLYCGDTVDVMRAFPPESVDVVWADPPYFLSDESGVTCKNGQMVGVDKGKWDRKRSLAEVHRFNGMWLRAARRLLRSDGTIWICGSHHNIHSVGVALVQLGYHVLNEVVWEKPNPPPNLACRYLTHSHETLLWAAKSRTARYHFDYEALKRLNADKQMRDVWRGPPPNKAEKTGHPTQKPLWLVSRCLNAAAKPGAVVLDPFNGSGTTGEAVVSIPDHGWQYLGIDHDGSCLDTTRERLLRERPLWH